jgi:hypothetical protein
VNLFLFLAAVVCFALALVTILVPTSIVGAPAVAWAIGGLLAWLLCDHLRGYVHRDSQT